MNCTTKGVKDQVYCEEMAAFCKQHCVNKSPLLHLIQFDM
ncbi:hypothetical protein [Yersinia phage YeP6]|nr:hypothetical protein [Yersinia phage YeP4]QCW23553.1 hypothetical protein [Yersinia phage YeP5]QCW23591.1 hypothetical protein [Yersinia phage YeP6]